MKKAATSLRRTPGSGPIKKDALFTGQEFLVVIAVLLVVVAGAYGISA